MKEILLKGKKKEILKTTTVWIVLEAFIEVTFYDF